MDDLAPGSDAPVAPSAPAAPSPRKPKGRRSAKRFLLTGLATLLPTLLTLYIIYVCYVFVHTNLGRWIALPLAHLLGQWDPAAERITNPYTVVAGDVLAVVIVVAIAFLVGAMAASFLGRRIVRAGEHLLGKVPVVKTIYPYVKQLTDFFFSSSRARFHSTVLIPFPCPGVYSLAFVTGSGMRTVNQATGEEMVQVFVPFAPAPITGYAVFVPRRDIIELALTVEEALRFLVTAGVLVPNREVVAPPPGEAGAQLPGPDDEDVDE
jgi:uncharacterized membrane protein